ncbi:tyrosine-type recombinase/integrase [Actinoplanes sp. NPDC051861]|uniref:tyrosine-type recombinase/integrase n=1 Tax=Actinoplanes sp. NPDC051861 TaxID=3155170 RepID=UPI0034268D97
MKLRRRSHSTVRDYWYSYRTLTEWLGKPASEATRLDLEAWFESRLDDVSATRVRQDQRNLSAFYRWALAEEIITVNPLARIPRIEVEEKPARVLDPADGKALLDACRGNKFNDVRDMAIIRTLRLIGTPRMGELSTMTVAAVDLRNDLLALSGKTGYRMIPMGDATGLAFERYLRARAKHRHADAEALWLGKKGRMTRTGIQMLIARRVEKAGIQVRVHAHLFRHTSATEAADAGLSPEAMEFLYGWSPGSPMTRHYTRATRAQRAQEAARKLTDRN